ncbi:MAG TPA: ATP-binding cassette domain-containing protein [Thermomicrobiales bacterium]|nr:ATP-binding cassette domain-containing protein [Thermomicrobiales bacterium]
MNEAIVQLESVYVWTAEGVNILRDLSWKVRAGEHWALLGPNGSGKSTLLSLLATMRHPSEGTATVLGGKLGKTNLWALRERIGVVDPTMRMPEELFISEVVLTGATNTVQPLWDRYGPTEQSRARDLLDLLGCGDLADRSVATCSQGERQRVRIARALMAEPPLLLLDEPANALDLPAREALLAALAALADARPELATVLVSHHVEELPPSTTHALLLRQGEIVAAGPVGATLTSDLVSTCFGLPIEVERRFGRWNARASAAWERR